MKLLSVLIIAVMLCNSSVFALTPKEEKGVIVLKSPGLEWETPDRLTPFPLDEAPDDIEYRKSIIPFEQDRDEDVYIVMPTIGVVAPIIFVPPGTNDYDEMVAGKQIDINTYLDRGAMHYPRTGMPGEIGNPVIFAHSNFFTNGVGDYKTIFADIMDLDPISEDEIWFFVRESGEESYELRKFAIEESYETVPTDVGVMRPQGGKEVTVFACTNGLAGRWILKGRYIEKDEMLVPYTMKWEFEEMLVALQQFDSEKRQDIIMDIMSAIEEKRISVPTTDLDYHDKFKKYLLNYFEKKLIEVY